MMLLRNNRMCQVYSNVQNEANINFNALVNIINTNINKYIAHRLCMFQYTQLLTSKDVITSSKL